MTPKQYLAQVRSLRAKYKRACEDYQEVESLMTSAGAIRYDKLNVQTSPDGDMMAEYMVRLEKAEAKALHLAAEYLEKFEQIREQIDMISPQIYSDILYLRYIHGMSLWSVSEELNYSYGYTKHMHGLALAEFGKVFADQLKEHTQTHIGV